MQQIWKFPLEIGANIIPMPVGARIVHAHMQNGVACLWALVDPSEPKVARSFHVAGTGWDVDGQRMQYVGTVHGGAFVWHIFEVN